MPYTEAEAKVLSKYKLIEPDGMPRMVTLAMEEPGYPALGYGPVLSEDATTRLIQADSTPDQRWLEWIFFQAGGGQQARNATVTSMALIKERFIDERVTGWTRPDNGELQHRTTREEAEQRWNDAEPGFKEIMVALDQDGVLKLHNVFGYFREWPGQDHRYSNVVSAITRFLKFYDKAVQMNDEIGRQGGGEPVAVTPEAIPTWENMVEITKKVERYFASQKARTDIREETIYDDEIITALAPLTYAAAVEYGYDLWPFSSRKGFQGVLTADPEAYRAPTDEWKTRTRTAGTVIVFLTFKQPTPVWTVRRGGGEPERKDLRDLALVMDRDMSRQNVNNWTVVDQENRDTLTIEAIKQMIMAEPTRVDDPQTEVGWMRGKNVYKDEGEATRVVASLDRALKRVKEWYATFDRNKIKSDVFTLD